MAKTYGGPIGRYFAEMHVIHMEHHLERFPPSDFYGSAALFAEMYPDGRPTIWSLMDLTKTTSIGDGTALQSKTTTDRLAARRKKNDDDDEELLVVEVDEVVLPLPPDGAAAAPDEPPPPPPQVRGFLKAAMSNDLLHARAAGGGEGVREQRGPIFHTTYGEGNVSLP